MKALDAVTMRRLLVHEALVHAIPGRILRDLGDSILLHDPRDREPFWNRLEAVTWPADPPAFDRRLAEIGIVFATLGRQPHIWASPSHDSPPDLAARLAANGFEDVGPGFLMVTQDDSIARAALDRPAVPRARVERMAGLRGDAAADAARVIAGVLVDAFGVETAREPNITAETIASFADPRFMNYVAWLDDEPVAVARRATFDGASYLSSIGTVERVRGQGMGRLVTASAVVDAAVAGSEWIHLGVFAENRAALRLYEGIGFRPTGIAGPDMVLIG